MLDIHVRRTATKPVLVALGVTLAVALVFSASGDKANAALGTLGDPDFLGNAESFAVVGGSTVTNVVDATLVPQTVVDGDIGLSPGTSVTGFPPGVIVPPAQLYVNDAALMAFNAQADASAAWSTLNLLPTDTSAASVLELGGTSPAPGVHFANEFLLNGTVTLVGDWDDVWVFQAGSTLTTGTSSVVSLIGANPCNVYWQLDTAGTLGTSTSFVGTILAGSSITANTGATIEGRLLAQAAVTLDHNQISTPTCLTAPPDTDVDGATDADTDGATDADGAADADGATDGDTDGATDADTDGATDGDTDTDGGTDTDADADADADGGGTGGDADGETGPQAGPSDNELAVTGADASLLVVGITGVALGALVLFGRHRAARRTA